MHQDIKEILLTEEQIAARVHELGAQITKDYAGKTILMCGILKGAVTFFTDLARCIDGPVYFDFMSCSSYGSSTTSSGVLKIRKDLDNDVKDKDVLIVEDIIDTGVTLSHLVPMLKERAPARSNWLRSSASRPAVRSKCLSTTTALKSPMPSSSAMASTTTAVTATCRISVS